MDLIICEFCNTTFKNNSNLKTHLVGSKKCLKSRGLVVDSNYKCKGCNSIFMTKINLSVHQDSCKNYNLMILSDNFTIKITKIEEQNKELEEQNKELEEQNKKLEEKNKKIENTNKEQLIIIQNSSKRIEQLEINVKKNIVDHDDYIKLQVKYDELSKQHEKTIEKLELKISQCDSFIQTLAREGSNKPTTTTNNTINNIRNHLSSTYTIDKLESKTVEDIFREHYTEFDYYSGQKGLANFFLERVIKTPDGKMMICCTDTSRKKFKILDMKGNLKEDIEARVLCEKLKVPTEVVTKEMYDKIITKIDEERERLSRDDRSLKEKLIDDSMRAQQVFIDNMNFDDVNYNQDFMHELCVLLNV